MTDVWPHYEEVARRYLGVQGYRVRLQRDFGEATPESMYLFGVREFRSQPSTPESFYWAHGDENVSQSPVLSPFRELNRVMS